MKRLGDFFSNLLSWLTVAATAYCFLYLAPLMVVELSTSRLQENTRQDEGDYLLGTEEWESRDELLRNDDLREDIREGLRYRFEWAEERRNQK